MREIRGRITYAVGACVRLRLATTEKHIQVHRTGEALPQRTPHSQSDYSFAAVRFGAFNVSRRRKPGALHFVPRKCLDVVFGKFCLNLFKTKSFFRR